MPGGEIMNCPKFTEIKTHLLFWALLTAACFAGNKPMAQKHYNFFYGKIFETGTKKGIAGVNLAIVGSRSGTVTDRRGEFSFFTDSLPVTLTVSHIGFETKTILLDATSFSLTLYLTRKATELQEVEIKARAHEVFFKNDQYSILDYEIDSNMIYLLVFRQNLSKSEMICKNTDGDTVATSKPFYFRPEKLFRDCLGNLHLLGHDSGFQIYREDKRLLLIHPVNLKKFEDVLKNCVASTPEILFFQKTTDHGLGVEFFGINRKTLLKNPIARVADEKQMKMLRRNPEDARMMQSMIQPDSREGFVTWNFVHKILYRPVKTTLYRIGGFTCIFNTPDRQIEFYDIEGNFSYKLELKTDKIRDGRWTNDIVIDERKQKAFTTFISNGQYTLYEIDMNSGFLKKRLTLYHYYPEKIRVYDNCVYYLYDVPEDRDNKMLFRQKF